MRAIIVAANITRGRRGDHKVNPFLRNQLLPLPLATVQVQQAKTSEITRIRVHLAAKDKVTKAVGARERAVHAKRTEQCRLRITEIVHWIFKTLLQRKHGKECVVIFVLPVRAWLTHQPSIQRSLC